MQVATEVPFASPRIAARFADATRAFLLEAHTSLAATATVACLYGAESDQRYATGNRNACVEQLAKDVETVLGTPANLLFRTPGPLHDSLQTLMDAYEDAMDGIYYLTN